MIAKKLQINDTIRVIAPSRSLSIISSKNQQIAVDNLKELGLKISIGKYAKEINNFDSSSITSRVFDLHNAFQDKNIKAILTAIGGFNANQLLDYLDFDLIGKNPKIICGYSDITVILNSIFQKTGLLTYYGPHFSTFGVLKGNEYIVEYFKKCLMQSKGYYLSPSSQWSDDEWYLDQNNRKFIHNDGYQVFSEGQSEGTLIGGNLDTFNLLQGTPYFPVVKDAILFIEEDNLANDYMIAEFDRNLQSLLQVASLKKELRGILIGRFQKKPKMSFKTLEKILKGKNINNIPIIYNLDFGHTLPMVTLPIGGKVELTAKRNRVQIRIKYH